MPCIIQLLISQISCIALSELKVVMAVADDEDVVLIRKFELCGDELRRPLRRAEREVREASSGEER
jgi:hypothetical protein